MYLDSVWPQLIKSIKSWQMVFTRTTWQSWWSFLGSNSNAAYPAGVTTSIFFHFTKYQILCYNNMPTMIIRCIRCHVRSMVWIELRMGEIFEVTERWYLTDVGIEIVWWAHIRVHAVEATRGKIILTVPLTWNYKYRIALSKPDGVTRDD